MCYARKPLALTVAEADRVASAARAHNRVLFENFSYHLTRDYQSLRPMPISIEITFCFQATEEHRLRYNAALGGGSFLDLGCYGVDFVHRLLDRDVEILDVIAMQPAAERRAWGSVDETCVVHARSVSGTGIKMTTSFAMPPRQDIVLSYPDGEQRTIERADDAIAMLRAFALRALEGMRTSEPADIVRWRRNASVLEQVRARMQY